MLSTPDVLTLDAIASRLALLDSEVGSLYERVPFGAHSVADDGTYAYINALELSWLGCKREDVVGKKKPTDFLTPASQLKLSKHLASFGAHGFVDLELNLVDHTGVPRPIAMNFNGRSDAQGRPQQNRYVSFDMTAAKLQVEKQRIAAIAFESLAGICVTDPQGVILQVNHAFTALTGYSAGEAVGKTMRLLHSGHHDQAFYQAMWKTLQTRRAWQGEIYNRCKDGSIMAEWLSISAIASSDGAVSNYVGTFYDITSDKAAQEQVSHMAYFDALTQLPNRRLLQDRITQTLAAMQRSPVHGALLFLDMDNFKAINDTRGHDAGDLLLIEVASRLLATVREGDSVARIGGDEFVILLDQLGANEADAANQAKLIGRKLLDTMMRPYMLGDFEFHCSASIGITLFAGGASSAQLLQQADLAMYEAKKLGKNTLHFFDPKMQAAVTARAALEQDLHQALIQREFQLYFQPQVNAKGKIVAAEALLRWYPRGRMPVSPAAFIPVAEETGLILPLGRWVLATACAQLKQWALQPKTQGLKLAVNVSARQFLQPDFLAQVQESVLANRINPALLMLEVTESLVLNVADAIARMNALRHHGLTFAIDDFGTGFSSLASLTQLPLDQLKIDQSFVRRMTKNPIDATIVRTIIAMAHSLELEVIAEGVETREQQAMLAGYGCNFYQGFLFSPAVDIASFEALLDAPDQ